VDASWLESLGEEIVLLHPPTASAARVSAPLCSFALCSLFRAVFLCVGCSPALHRPSSSAGKSGRRGRARGAFYLERTNCAFALFRVHSPQHFARPPNTAHIRSMEHLLAAALAAEPRTPLRGPTRLTEELEQRWSIVSMHKDGRSKRYIARHLHCHRDTVTAALTRFAATGSPMSGSRSGRPRCTSEATDTASSLILLASTRSLHRVRSAARSSTPRIPLWLAHALSIVASKKQAYSDVSRDTSAATLKRSSASKLERTNLLAFGVHCM
jgi:hypothetical protein